MAITIKYQPKKADIYLACVGRFFKLYSMDDEGKLRSINYDTKEITLSTFVQGREQICNNNSVIHVHVDGTITAIPVSKNGPVLTVKTNSTSGGIYVTNVATYVTGANINSRVYWRAEMVNPSANRHIKYYQYTTEDLYYAEENIQPDDRFYGYGAGYIETESMTWPDILSLSAFTLENGRYLWNNKVTIHHSDNRASSSYTAKDLTLRSLGTACFPAPNLSGVEPRIGNSAVPPDDLFIRLSEKIGPLQVNNLSNIESLRKWREIIPRIGPRKVKTLAELYLWYKYAYSTSKMDLEEMFKFFTRSTLRESKNKSKGYDHRVTLSNLIDNRTTDTFTFYFGSFEYALLDKFGLRLNFANTWDMIPFSFVVDWFTKIGDMLASLDARDFWVQVPLMCYVQTRSSKKDVYLDNAFTDLVQTSYIRDVSTKLPATVVSPSLNMPNSHNLEAISLVIANHK